MEAVEYSCSCPFSKMVVAVGRRLGAMAAAVKAQEEIYWCGDESRVEVKQLAGSPAQPSPPPLLSLLMMMTSPTMANPFASCPRVFALRSAFFFPSVAFLAFVTILTKASPCWPQKAH